MSREKVDLVSLVTVIMMVPLKKSSRNFCSRKILILRLSSWFGCPQISQKFNSDKIRKKEPEKSD